jgi:hypothetical protein
MQDESLTVAGIRCLFGIGEQRRIPAAALAQRLSVATDPIVKNCLCLGIAAAAGKEVCPEHGNYIAEKAAENPWAALALASVCRRHETALHVLNRHLCAKISLPGEALCKSLLVMAQTAELRVAVSDFLTLLSNDLTAFAAVTAELAHCLNDRS